MHASLRELGGRQGIIDLSSALAAAKMAAWTYRAEDRRLEVTQEFKELLALPPDAAIKIDDLLCQLAPEDASRVRACVKAALRKDGFIRIDLQMRRFDGALRWFLLRASAVCTADGRLSSITGMLIDLTERKLEELANAHLAAVVTSTPYPIICVDMSGLVTVWNEGAERTFGFAGSDMIGRPLTRIVPSDKTAELAEIWRYVFNGETRHWETERLHFDGRHVPVKVTAAPIFAPDGEVVGLSGIYEDRTEARASQERLNLLIRELHHRVRNTLATVQGIAGVTAAASETIEDFRDAFTRRIAALAATHLRLTEASQQSICVSDLIEQELGPFITNDRVCTSGPRVELDSSIAPTLAMAIHELATNAMKHGALRSDAGSIEVAWNVQDGRMRLNWSEHGAQIVALPTRRGFGAKLLDQVIPLQFGAPVVRSFAHDGIRVHIDMPESRKAGL